LNSFEIIRNDSFSPTIFQSEDPVEIDNPYGQTTVSMESMFHEVPTTNKPLMSYLMEDGFDRTMAPLSTGRGKSIGSSTFSEHIDEDKKNQPIVIAGKWIVQKTPCSVTCGQGDNIL